MKRIIYILKKIKYFFLEKSAVKELEDKLYFETQWRKKYQYMYHMYFLIHLKNAKKIDSENFDKLKIDLHFDTQECTTLADEIELTTKWSILVNDALVSILKV